VKHYMFDFGSIMGSGTTFAQRHRAGNEYILEWKPGWLTLATLGIYTRPWLHYNYPDVPASVGRFEGDSFDPETWKPEYPNPAFRNMRADDAFWAARIVSRFGDDAIRAIVAKARYSDPQASDYIAATLIKRRDKVMQTWLAGVNPIVDVAMTADGELTFTNAAVDAGVSQPASGYRAVWSTFDNATGQSKQISETSAVATRLPVPSELSALSSSFVRVEIRATDGTHPSWSVPVSAYFRKMERGWQLVGFDRLPN